MCLLWSTNWGFISQKTAFFSHRRENLQCYMMRYALQNSFVSLLIFILYYLMCFRCRILTVCNLNYTSTTLRVESWIKIILWGTQTINLNISTRTINVEYHCSRRNSQDSYSRDRWFESGAGLWLFWVISWFYSFPAGQVPGSCLRLDHISDHEYQSCRHRTRQGQDS
jgi:hypothetical protein